MSYYDWMEATQQCPRCSWSGPGSEAKMGDSFDAGAEYHCPSCDRHFEFVVYPLTSEVKTDPRAGPVDRMAVALGESVVERAAAMALKSGSQLPDIEPGPTKLTWDVTYGEGFGSDSFVVILDGDQEIWREISLFEEYQRFGEIATILWEKYGKTLRDLEPTEGSWLNLGGDRICSMDYVERVRTRLASSEDPKL